MEQFRDAHSQHAMLLQENFNIDIKFKLTILSLVIKGVTNDIFYKYHRRNSILILS